MNGDITAKQLRVLRECAQLKYPRPIDEVGCVHDVFNLCCCMALTHRQPGQRSTRNSNQSFNPSFLQATIGRPGGPPAYLALRAAQVFPSCGPVHPQSWLRGARLHGTSSMMGMHGMAAFFTHCKCKCGVLHSIPQIVYPIYKAHK